MIGCEPVYTVLSGILQPDVTPPDITAVSVAAACSGIDTATSMLDMRVSVDVSEPAEVRWLISYNTAFPFSSIQCGYFLLYLHN